MLFSLLYHGFQLGCFFVKMTLRTYEPRKWDFPKHAQPQLKKARAYENKAGYTGQEGAPGVINS